MVIDGKVTLMGSMNCSSGAALNSENLNLVISPEVAETYAGHWRQRLAASVPFAGRDEWCRQPRPPEIPCEQVGVAFLPRARHA